MQVDPSLVIKHIESAQAQALKVVGRQRQESEKRAVQEAMTDLDALRSAYHEALVEQSHSVRVKQITDDLAGLASMLRGFGTESLSAEQEAQVRTRIRSWHYDSRRWIGDLPLQPSLTRRPEGKGAAEVRQLWLEAGGAWLVPPPHARRAPLAGTPAHLGLWHPLPSVWDPLSSHTPSADPGMTSRWVCRPVPLIELLALAQEALEVEIGGRNLGGHAPFAQRRRRASLKDAFAFTCLLIYKKAVGPKAARQRQFYPSSNPSSFESFVTLVHAWVVGPNAPKEWTLGPDPIRKAIATQRAWQKLFKAAGSKDEEAFNALPQEAQEAAERKLTDKVRRHLTARPLI